MKSQKKNMAVLWLVTLLAGCDQPTNSDQLNPGGGGSVLPNSAETVLTHGRIYTLDPSQPWVEAAAIDQGKFVYVGTNEGVKDFVGEASHLIDLKGKMVMPGINDSHSHPWQGGAKLLYECHFPFTATPTEIAERIKGCVKNQPDKAWIIGGQWTSDFFNHHPMASPRGWLDQVSDDKAVILEDDTGHNAWVNSKALALAGIDKNTPDPQGGTFVRDDQGEPNGLVLEAATHRISQNVPELTLRQNIAALAEAIKQANAFGLTGVNEARTPPTLSPAYQQLDKEGRLTAHVVTFLQTPRGKRDEPFDISPLEKISTEFRSEHVHTKFAKIFLDGVPTASRSAVMVEPYLVNEAFPETTTGVLLISPEALTQDLIELDRRGFTVKIHTAGDGAVRIALDAIAKMREHNGKSGLRHQLAHAGYIHPDDLPRFAELNVTADLSPYLWFPSPIIDSIVGAVGERAFHYWPIKSLLSSGADVLVGSDWPSAVDDMNPWPAVEAMISRKNPFSHGDQTLWAEQAISLEQALRIFTFDGARAYRLEDVTGSIEVGKSADFIVLDRNLFEVPVEAISDTRVEQTYFEGRLVYKAANNP